MMKLVACLSVKQPVSVQVRVAPLEEIMYKEFLIERIEALGGFRYVCRHPELWDDCCITHQIVE